MNIFSFLGTLNIVDSSLADIPRLHTAIAEWAACLLYLLIIRPPLFQKHKIRFALAAAGAFLVQYGFQWLAGQLPISLWIPNMLFAIVLMYACLHTLGRLNHADTFYCCLRAFVLAEFSASLEWQIYTWYIQNFGPGGPVVSLITMVLFYALMYLIFYFAEKKHIPPDGRLYVERKDLFSSVCIAAGAFCISNISFVMPNTPLSSTMGSVLYVRTLVDFGGLVMLFAQQDKREELRIRGEYQAMNNVLQRQYEQYQLAQNNIELLKKEFHDLKHYMIAIRTETDPDLQMHYLQKLDETISFQEALTNTGNHVLDVVLTTKSIYCTQHGITFNCLADGSLLSFMDVKDICSIFGNALDNAIECVEQCTDPEKRLIVLSLYRQHQFLMILFENYCINDLHIKNDLPPTTKKNSLFHGYGLKSIKQAAEKYGGSMTLHSTDNWFTLQILIPIPEEG